MTTRKQVEKILKKIQASTDKINATMVKLTEQSAGLNAALNEAAVLLATEEITTTPLATVAESSEPKKRGRKPKVTEEESEVEEPKKTKKSKK